MMHSNVRHLFLILGSVLVTLGILLLITSKRDAELLSYGGSAFLIGALMLARTLRRTHEIRRRDVEIKQKMMDHLKKDEETL